MELSLAGVAGEGRGDFMPLEDVLAGDEEFGQSVRGNGDVLDYRHRPAGSFQAAQGRMGFEGELAI